VGVSFSFEKTYQALRRSWRFGQKHPVDVHMIYSTTEGNVLETLHEKQELFTVMQKNMNAAMREHGLFRDSNGRGLISSMGHNPMLLPDWLYSKDIYGNQTN